MKTIILSIESAAKHGKSPADIIVQTLRPTLENHPDTALVCVLDNSTMPDCYLLALATKNERGYNPTNIVLNESNYHIADEWVHEANERIYKRTRGESARIVLSSMRSK